VVNKLNSLLFFDVLRILFFWCDHCDDGRATFLLIIIFKVASSTISFTCNIYFDTGTDLSFKWTFGDGTPDVITKVPNVNHTFNNKGCYNINYTAYNLVSSNSSKLNTICVQDTVIGIAINGSISGPGLNTNFVVSVSQGSDYTCNMTTGDGGSLT
jgi:PKD repeat protein